MDISSDPFNVNYLDLKSNYESGSNDRPPFMKVYDRDIGLER